MKCFYCDCGISRVSGEYYIIRKAVKPKGSANRFIDAGKCCSQCFDSGKSLTLIK